MSQDGSHQTNRDVYDITIIGAGPAGLFGAFYAGLRQLRTKIIEALPEVGGQLSVLYPEKFIYDVPGFPKILAKDLAKELTEQGLQFEPTVHLDERVDRLGILPAEDGDRPVIKLTTTRGVHYSRTVLIAAGVGAFSPNKLGAPGTDELEGRGIYYFVKDRRPFRGKRLLIIGGGDSAVDWALNMKDWAKSILLIHRRDVFRAHEGSVAELLTSGIPVRLFWELTAAHGDGHVEGVTIRSNKTGQEETLPVDAVLVNIGFKADLGPIKDWGLEIDKRAIVVNGRMETNLPGVFAVGDVCTYRDGITLNLIATGFAQAAVAVNCAKAYVDPKSKVFPGHSSELSL